MSRVCSSHRVGVRAVQAPWRCQKVQGGCSEPRGAFFSPPPRNTSPFLQVYEIERPRGERRMFRCFPQSRTSRRAFDPVCHFTITIIPAQSEIWRVYLRSCLARNCCRMDGVVGTECRPSLRLAAISARVVTRNAMKSLFLPAPGPPPRRFSLCLSTIRSSKKFEATRVKLSSKGLFYKFEHTNHDATCGSQSSASQ
jgi:hypothetical protein